MKTQDMMGQAHAMYQGRKRGMEVLKFLKDSKGPKSLPAMNDYISRDVVVRS